MILLFYPLDFTFVCPTELTAFSDQYDQFEGIGAEVIGISTDSAFSHRAWLQAPRDKGGVEGLNTRSRPTSPKKWPTITAC